MDNESNLISLRCTENMRLKKSLKLSGKYSVHIQNPQSSGIRLWFPPSFLGYVSLGFNSLVKLGQVS